MSALQFEAVKVALKQDATGYVLTVKIHPDEIPEELMRDFVGSRYAVALVRISDDESAVPVNNRVQKAGILCRDKWFFKFLKEFHGIDKPDENQATQFLYGYCGIRSRTELNGKGPAQKAFDSLLAEYDGWSEKNDPF